MRKNKKVKILTTLIILLLLVVIGAGSVLLWQLRGKLRSQIAQKEALQAQIQELEDQIDRNTLSQYFCAFPISDEIYERIHGKSYRENDNIGLEQLRYIKVLHYNFDHQLQMGELIVNADLAENYTNIFRELFEVEYEIQSMYLIDNYWTGDGDTSDTASIEVNNTSAFCYRAVTGGTKLSNHAFGRAIDINPQQNPYVSYSSGSPVWSHDNADVYIDRNAGLDHMIDHDDICYQIFVKYGFSWGGDWNSVKDYQHFEKE